MIYCYISAAMIVALAVFLYYNMFGSVEKKTKIYMGDSGSMLLGFSLAYLSIKYIVAEDEASVDVSARILLCISLLFVPCVDLCRVVLERIAHGEHPFMPDKRHIHHRLMSAGIFGNFTLAGVLALSLLFMVMNALLYSLGCSLSLVVSADIVLYIILMILLSRQTFSHSMLLLRLQEQATQARALRLLLTRLETLLLRARRLLRAQERLSPLL